MGWYTLTDKWNQSQKQSKNLKHGLASLSLFSCESGDSQLKKQLKIIRHSWIAALGSHKLNRV